MAHAIWQSHSQQREGHPWQAPFVVQARWGISVTWPAKRTQPDTSGGHTAVTSLSTTCRPPSISSNWMTPSRPTYQNVVLPCPVSSSSSCQHDCAGHWLVSSTVDTTVRQSPACLTVDTVMWYRYKLSMLVMLLVLVSACQTHVPAVRNICI